MTPKIRLKRFYLKPREKQLKEKLRIPKMVKIFAIILNFNGIKNTIECLESLQNINKKEFEFKVIVVDNNSKDGPVEKIKKEFPEILLIENQDNLGFTGGNNEGIRAALASGADFVMLLNNDTLVDKNSISNLLEAARDNNVGGVVPKIYFEQGYEFHKNRYKESEKGKVIWYAGGIMDWDNLIGKNRGVDEVDNGQFDTRVVTEVATGCCFLVRSDVLKNVGLFDDKYFLYYEDADLSEKIKKAGFEIIYQPKAIIWHKNAESSGGSGSDLQDYYISRNRLLFGMKYAPIRTKIALLKQSMVLLKSGRAWQKKGIRDFYLGKFGKGSFHI